MYTFKMLPNIEVGIVSILRDDRGFDIVPGISTTANVEIILFKDGFNLTSYLAELGDCFIVDTIDNMPKSRLSEAVKKAASENDTWDLSTVYYAAPVEIVKGGRYKMSSDNINRDPLFKCSSSSIFDSNVGTFNCLETCQFKIDYLMDACKLGVKKCSEGLYHVSTNKEIVSD